MLKSLLVATLIPLLLGCSKGPTVLIAVAQLPTSTTTLEVQSSLGGVDANEVPTFDLSGMVIDEKSIYRFGLRLPSSAVGELTVSAAAFDRSGCLLGTGDVRRLPAADLSPDKDVGLAINPLPPSAEGLCKKDRPVIHTITPSQDLVSTDPNPARSILGWGFSSKAQALIVPVPLFELEAKCLASCQGTGPNPSGMERRSASEVSFVADPVRNPSGFDSLCAQIQDGGRIACRPFSSYRYHFARTQILPKAMVMVPDAMGKPQQVSATVHVYGLALSDLNSDGIDDIVFSGYALPMVNGALGVGVVGILVGKGGGQFADAVYPYMASLGMLQSIVPAVAVTTLAPGGPKVILASLRHESAIASANDALLILEDPLGKVKVQPIPAGPKPDSLAVADFNGDGYQDVAVVNDPYNAEQIFSYVRILLGTPLPQRFMPPEPYIAGTVLGFVRAADLNGDGKPDLAVAGVRVVIRDDVPEASGGVTVLLNKGDGTFPKFPASAQGRDELNLNNYRVRGSFAGLLVEDMNQDGKPDLVTSGQAASIMGSNSSVTVLLNTGAKDNPNLFAPEGDFYAGSAPFGIAIADFTKDGRKDVIAANVRAMEQGTLSLLVNQSMGPRFPDNDLPSYPGWYGSSELLAGDLNKDGRPDVVASHLGLADPKNRQLLRSGSVTIYLNQSR